MLTFDKVSDTYMMKFENGSSCLFARVHLQDLIDEAGEQGLLPKVCARPKSEHEHKNEDVELDATPEQPMIFNHCTVNVHKTDSTKYDERIYCINCRFLRQKNTGPWCKIFGKLNVDVTGVALCHARCLEVCKDKS